MNYTAAQLLEMAAGEQLAVAQAKAEEYRSAQAASESTHAVGEMAPWLAEMAAKWQARANDTELQKAAEAERLARLREIERTRRAEREDHWLKLCPRDFAEPVDWAQVANPAAFRKVLDWDGSYPGLLLIGPTGTGKSRSAWQVLKKLCVEKPQFFRFYKLRSLLSELAEFEKNGNSRAYSGPNPYYIASGQIVFIDDIDKANRQFHSQISSLWDYYDWIRSERIPSITTTNISLQRWEQEISPSFARRLKEAHTLINF